jgi:hypothetical protein
MPTFPLTLPLTLAGGEATSSISFPRDTWPLYLAVVNALTRFTGLPRCIPRDRLFALGKPGDLEGGARAGEVFRQPRCFVAPIRTTPTDPQLQMTTRSRHDVEVEIRCWYYSHEIHTPEWMRVMERVERDKHLVADALTFPGNLLADPIGRSTGLDGYSLRRDDGRWEPRGPVLVPGKTRVVQLTHVFRASVELEASPAS